MNKKTALEIQSMYSFLDNIQDPEEKRLQSTGILNFLKGYISASLEDSSGNSKLIDLDSNARYPICPGCGEQTIVLFGPPKEGYVGTEKGYETIGTQEYTDWDKARLYCCNATKNCKFNTLIRELTTPLKQKS